MAAAKGTSPPGATLGSGNTASVRRRGRLGVSLGIAGRGPESLYSLRLRLSKAYGPEKFSSIMGAIETYKTEQDYHRLLGARLRTIAGTLGLDRPVVEEALQPLQTETFAFLSAPTFERAQSVAKMLSSAKPKATGILAPLALRVNADIDGYVQLFGEYETQKGKSLEAVLEEMYAGEGKRICDDFAPIIQEMQAARSVQAFFPAPDGHNTEEVEAVGRAVAGSVARHFSGMSERLVWEATSPQEMREFLTLPRQEEGTAFDAVLRFFEEVIGRRAMRFAHPRFMGHMHPGGTTAAIFAEALIGALQENLVAHEVSPVMSAVEDQMEAWLCRMVGFNDPLSPVQGEPIPGVAFTTGGTAANLTALLIARNLVLGRRLQAVGARANIKREGLPVVLRVLERKGDIRALRIVASEAVHYSVEKAAGELGLGEDAVIRVPVDGMARMRIRDLRRILRGLPGEGAAALAVMGTLGTTETGNVDPVRKVIAAAREHRTWVHLDGAWGAPFMLLPELRHTLFAGVGLADSVTVDPHKMLQVPYSLGATVLRDRNALLELEACAPYLFNGVESSEAVPAIGEFRSRGKHSIVGSRRADAFKLWIILQVMGIDGIQTMLRRTLDMTRSWEAIVREMPEELEPLSQPELNLFCFRYVPPEIKARLDAVKAAVERREIKPAQARKQLAAINAELNRLNHHLQKNVLAEGECYVSFDTLSATSYADGDPSSANSKIGILRTVLLNPFTTIEDLIAIRDILLRVGRQEWETQREGALARLASA